MKKLQFDNHWAAVERFDLEQLLWSFIKTIGDNDRATVDPEDTIPGMLITISINANGSAWNYQTGDNSFTGDCYGDPYWGVGYLYRDSDPTDVAEQLINDLAAHIEFED